MCLQLSSCLIACRGRQISTQELLPNATLDVCLTPHLASKITFVLFNLYVPALYVEKKDCWQTLSDFLDDYSPKNIILIGDYNLIFDPKKKRGVISTKDHFLPFVEDLIQQWDSLDFKPKKGLYTWSNNRAGAEHISTCLGRFLIQSSFLSKKKIISTKILPKLTFDHKPILLLFEEEEKLGPIPFQFNPLWSNGEGFMDTIMKAWSILVLGSPNVWEQKLKDTKRALKECIKKSFKLPNYVEKAEHQAATRFATGHGAAKHYMLRSLE